MARHRRASVLAYVMILMVVLTGFVSLGVDWGRVQLVKSELQTAADAAARYASTGAADGTCVAKAVSAAALNTADSSTVVVQSSDVIAGNYNPLASPKFSTSRTPLNAVQVTACRTAARGNAVSLYFGGILGRANCDARATAVAYYGPPLKALLVVGAIPFSAGDQMVNDRLTALGFTVTAKLQGSAVAADCAGMGVVVISESVSSGVVGATFRDVAVPVLLYEPLIFDDMQVCAPTYGTDYDWGPTNSQVTITTPGHPVAAGYTGTVSVLNISQTYTWGIPQGTGVVVASIPGTPSHAAILAYDKGATMYGMTAPSRRVTWFCNGFVGTDQMTTQGWAMFDAAILWFPAPTRRW